MEKMLVLDTDHSCSQLSEEEIAAAQALCQEQEIPFFATYQPDLQGIQAVGERYKDKRHVIVEGNGGSISTLRAYLSCFGSRPGQEVFLLDTSDPDCVAEIKRKCPAEDSLLIVISKSGESIDAVSGYLSLPGYETVLVTGKSGALFEIGQTQHLTLLNHPDISGRFSGITECALFPAAVLGMDTEEIVFGARDMYGSCAPSTPLTQNPALLMALHLDKLEKMGYDEIFLSLYSKRLSGFFELIVQLIHESVCKGDKGQTVYGGEAPENQHHTLQRFNYGKRNSVGLFLALGDDGSEAHIEVPEELAGIRCRNISLQQLGKMTMGDVLRTEFEGTWRDTVEEGIPALLLELPELSPRAAGGLVAFLHYFTYYSALLRGVNPFDQPGVERSKEYIFQLVGER